MFFAGMGVLMFLLPMGGFAAGLILFLVHPLRPLAPFAFLVPVLSCYGALVCFVGSGIILEALGLRHQALALAMWTGMATGGGLGIALGVLAGVGINRVLARRS